MIFIDYYIIDLNGLIVAVFVIIDIIHYFKNNVFTFITYIIENKLVMVTSLNINSYKIDIP